MEKYKSWRYKYVINLIFTLFLKVEPLLSVLVKNKNFANLITREELGKFEFSKLNVNCT